MTRVRIIEDEQEDTGKKDSNGKPIVHRFMIENVATGEILGKYRERETMQKNGQETEIDGQEAAEIACKINGWKLVK
jgi:hypothetical protein